MTRLRDNFNRGIPRFPRPGPGVVLWINEYQNDCRNCWIVSPIHSRVAFYDLEVKKDSGITCISVTGQNVKIR